jgi:hypothetical protein
MIFYLIKAYFKSILKNRNTVYYNIKKNEAFFLNGKEIIFFYDIIELVDFFLFLANDEDKKVSNFGTNILKEFYKYYDKTY